MSNILKNILFFVTILIISCDEKSNIQKNKTELINNKRSELKVKNKQESNSISTKYNAIIGWDTVKQYTYQLQELFATNSKPISFVGEIDDIIKYDSIYILKLYSSSHHTYKDFIAEVELSPTLLKELSEKIKSKKHTIEGCFVFIVMKIESVSPKLTSDFDAGTPTEDDANLYSLEDASSFLEYDFDETLIKFKGKLIDFYIFDQLQSDE